MSDGYTDQEERLLARYGVIRDIQEGRRKLQPAKNPEQPKRTSVPATATSNPTSNPGQRLPSKIRLKANKQATFSEPSSPVPPRSPVRQPPQPAAAAATAASKPEVPVGQEQPVRATISRAELASLLKQKQQEQQHQQQLEDVSTVSTALPVQPQAPLASSTAAPVVITTNKAVSQRRVLPAATAPLPAAAMSAAMRQQVPPRQQAPPAPAIADVDYDAVSSPEYEVDYDAVSSPEYDPVSVPNKDSSKSPKAARGHSPAARHTACNAAAADAKRQQPISSLQQVQTPERQDQRWVPAAATVTPSARHSSSQGNYAAPGDDNPRDSAAAGCRGVSRSPSSSSSPPRRHRHSSRQHSPSVLCTHSCRSRIYYRSSSRDRSSHRSRSSENSRGYDVRGSGSQHQSTRSSSRSRNRGGCCSYKRRGSPDYTLGAGTGAVAISAAGNRSSPAANSSPALVSDARAQQQQQQDGTDWPAEPGRRVLFVGDLPSVGFTSDDLKAVFTAFGWDVIGARVMGSQCYGFVEFNSTVEAQEALHLVELHDPRLQVRGQLIRASWARGVMPGWKRGKAVLLKRDKNVGLEGLEAYEHPTARLMRLQAAAAAQQGSVGWGYGYQGVAAQQGQAEYWAGSRQLVDYGDL